MNTDADATQPCLPPIVELGPEELVLVMDEDYRASFLLPALPLPLGHDG